MNFSSICIIFQFIALFSIFLPPFILAEENQIEVSFTKEEMGILNSFSPLSLPLPPTDSSNKFSNSEKAADLGRKLFFDPRFSGKLTDGDNDGSSVTLGKKYETGKVACAGCHLPEHGFSDFRTSGRAISLAAGWGKRRAISLLDVAQSKLFMWDGRIDTLQAQIFSVIESPVEMNSSRLFFAHKLFENYKVEYEDIFGKFPDLSDTTRFPKISPDEVGCHFKDGKAYNDCVGPQRGAPGDLNEFDHMSVADQNVITQIVINAGKALSAYERHLSCGQGRFDKWMHGDKGALNVSEKKGAKLFIGKAQCATCHSGPFLTDHKFHNLGIIPAVVAVVFRDDNTHGAAEGLRELEQNPLRSKGIYSDGDTHALDAFKPLLERSDSPLEGAFKTPTLRCLSGRPTYMHTGQYKNLEDVISFLNLAPHENVYNQRSELKPLSLSVEEQHDLASFLLTLDGLGPDKKWLH